MFIRKLTHTGSDIQIVCTFMKEYKYKVILDKSWTEPGLGRVNNNMNVNTTLDEQYIIMCKKTNKLVGVKYFLYNHHTSDDCKR